MSAYLGHTHKANVKPIGGFGRYWVVRCGLRYELTEVGEDDIVRSLYIGKFWRFLPALRIAQALSIAFSMGGYIPSEEVE